MKKVIFFFIVILSVSTSFTMDENNIAQIQCVAFLAHNKLAIGTDRGFNFIKNQDLSSPKWLNISPTYDIITNPNKERVAFLCKQFCFIYDAETEKQLNKFHISDRDNDPHKISYTAAFSSVDDTFFICQNEKLIFDGSSIQLPYTGNTNFSITCHPTKKQILYPNGPQSLLIKNFDGSPSIRYSFDQQINYETIVFAMFNPHDHCITLLTNKKELYLYDPTKKDSAVRLIFMHPCHTVTSIPYTSFIAALSDHAILCYDLIKSSTAIMLHFNPSPTYSDRLTHTFDFSPNGSEYAIILGNQFFIFNTPFALVEKLYFFIYWQLKKYCIEMEIPNDVYQLLIKKLLMLI